MLYIGYLIILDGKNIKKSVLEISIFELPRLENCRSRLCPGPLPRRGGCPAFWEGPCTGVSPGGPSPGGPGRPDGPARARRKARPLPRAGPQGRAPGVLARPGAGLSDSVGPLRGRCVLHF